MGIVYASLCLTEQYSKVVHTSYVQYIPQNVYIITMHVLYMYKQQKITFSFINAL